MPAMTHDRTARSFGPAIPILRMFDIPAMRAF
jgi:hypothetical protein